MPRCIPADRIAAAWLTGVALAVTPGACSNPSEPVHVEGDAAQDGASSMTLEVNGIGNVVCSHP
jgi:hypothetical protein